jgi:membrane fusion protein, multidrug efflux system
MKPSSLHASLLCLTVLALTACGKGKPQTPPAMPPPEVGVIKVTPQNVPLTKDLVGRLTAYRSADVRARVPGVLLKRTYEEGTDVKQGQLLFQIDPAPLKAALGASSGALAQAQAAYTNAKTFAQRARELAPKGFISKVDLDNALAAERSAAAAVQAASANAQSARINLGYASVTAPIAGRAGKQQVTEGALVGNGEATLLTTVEQIDPLYVNFTMSVAAMQQMRSAQRSGNLTLAKPDQATVRITLPDGSTYGEPGVLNFSDTSVNPATGAVDLRATIPNPEHRLLPGMYVTLTATLGEQNKVFVVPQQAVLRDTVGAYVMAIGADGKVERKDVTTADTQGGNWIITSGLKPGDTLVVSGIQNVKAGEPAKASPWHAPAPAGSKPAVAGTAHSGN